MRWHHPLLAACALSLTSCSLVRFKTSECTPAACQEAFGIGSTCDADDLCQPVEFHPRCDSTFPEGAHTRPQDFAGAVVFGTVFNKSSDGPNIAAANLAFQNAQETADLAGRDFVAVHCDFGPRPEIDDNDETEAAVEVATWLSEVMGVSAIVGPPTSGESTAVYNATKDLGGVLIVSPSATAPSLSVIDGATKSDESPGLYWRTAASDENQARVIARDMEHRGVSKVALVFQDSAYASELSEEVKTNFKGASTLHLYETETQIADAIFAATDEDPDEIFFASSLASDMAAFMNTLDLAYPGTIFLPDSGADNEGVLAEVRRTEHFCAQYGSRPGLPEGSTFELFASRFNALGNETAAENVFAAYTYDAAWLVLYGALWSIETTGEVTPIGMARGLRNISDPKGKDLAVGPGDYSAVQAEFAEGRPVNLTGASSELDFDPNTEELVVPYEIWRVDQRGNDYVLCVEGVCPADGSDCTYETPTCASQCP